MDNSYFLYYLDSRLELDPDEDYLIGRSPGNHVLLPHISVSRSHARMSWSDSGFEIEFPDPPTTSDDDDPVFEDPELEEDTNPTPVYHTVVRGETLFGLSRKYGSSVEDIKRLNSLDGNVISVGQVLRVK